MLWNKKKTNLIIYMFVHKLNETENKNKRNININQMNRTKAKFVSKIMKISSRSFQWLNTLILYFYLLRIITIKQFSFCG